MDNIEDIASAPLQTDLSPLWSQFLVLCVVVAIFFAGLVLRGMAENDRLSGKQYFATGAIVFITFALPLCEMVNQTIKDNQDNLFAILIACIPPFTAGVGSREQIKKLFK